jgi:hypothetical protein
MCEQYELVVGTVNFMSLTTHRWRDPPTPLTQGADRWINRSQPQRPLFVGLDSTRLSVAAPLLSSC